MLSLSSMSLFLRMNVLWFSKWFCDLRSNFGSSIGNLRKIFPQTKKRYIIIYIPNKSFVTYRNTKMRLNLTHIKILHSIWHLNTGSSYLYTWSSKRLFRFISTDSHSCFRHRTSGRYFYVFDLHVRVLMFLMVDTYVVCVRVLTPNGLTLSVV